MTKRKSVGDVRRGGKVRTTAPTPEDQKLIDAYLKRQEQAREYQRRRRAREREAFQRFMKGEAP